MMPHSSTRLFQVLPMSVQARRVIWLLRSK